ncbi:MAG: ribonuclease R [Lachnospiraceae bacterium]|nr:ribonuclease R [Lachnospiraceae bacterium]
MKSLYDERKNMIDEYIHSKEYKPIKLKQMAMMLGVPSEDKAEFRQIIRELTEDCRISIDKHGKIRPHVDELISGTFSQTQRGFGFVIPDEEGEDIFIRESDTGNAMHGDKVKVKLNNFSRGKRREGSIVEITERAVTTVVGTLDKSDNFAFVISDNVRLIKDTFIPKEKIGDARDGQKVVALITDYGKGKKNPEGEIIDILGYPDEVGVDILSIAKSFGLPDSFPANVIKEAKRAPVKVVEEDIQGRKDIRDWLTITIDGEDAKDLDDAVTLTFENGIYTLGVHIADVTHYVKEGKPLDKEALKRGTSAYLVDRVIPMLPRELSNGICSLNEGVDRLCLSCIMQLDMSGNVIGHEIAETVINVNHRMSYTVVNRLVSQSEDSIREEESAEYIKYRDIYGMLKLMEELAQKRIDIRKKQGSIDFDFPESKILLDEKGWPVEIKPYERNIATRIIEEFMLITNETIAEDYFWQEQPFLYRSHENPDPDKIQELSLFISNFGFHMKRTGTKVHPMEVQKLLAGIRGTAEENLISRLALRSMKRAKYTPTADGHFGLAMKYYCHFTSPIRRYPDLQIHRIIKENIHGELSEKKKEHYHSILPGVAETSSMLERRAEEAEREVHKLKKAQYMSNHVGETFDGIISGITGWGIYVELPNTVEGMVRLEELFDDEYYYDESNYQIVGRYSGNVYSLGQRVKVKVLHVDLDVRTIDFVFDA